MATNVAEVVQLSFPIPRSVDKRVYLRLSASTRANVLSLMTAGQDELAASTALGSFVYSIPNRLQAQEPLATTLFVHEPSLDLTLRVAKIISRRTKTPTYVTSSIHLADITFGSTIEEEMEVLKRIIDVVLSQLQSLGLAGQSLCNGKSDA